MKTRHGRFSNALAFFLSTGVFLCGSPAAWADPCHEEICDPATGQCRPVPNPNDAACHQAFIVTSTGYGGQVFLVDLLSGGRRLISDSSDPNNPGNQGPPFGYPSGIAVEPPSPSSPLGSILVADSAPYSGSTGAIFRVDPTSGNRSVVTEWTAAPGWPPGAGVGPFRIAWESPDTIVAVTLDGGSAPHTFDIRGSLLRIDLTQPVANFVNGGLTLLADFGDSSGGPLGSNNIYDVAIRGSGQYIVADAGGFGPDGYLPFGLFEVTCDSASPPSCSRTFSPDVLGTGPWGIALDQLNGRVYAAEPFSLPNYTAAVFRIDINQSPQWQPFSDFTDQSQGEPRTYAALYDAEWDFRMLSNGGVWALAQTTNVGVDGELFLIDPANGSRTAVSRFDDPAQGDTGSSPLAMTLYVGANTSTGTNVVVHNGDVTLTFESVTQAGNTSVTTSSTGPPPPAGFSLGDPPTYFNISTTAVFSGLVDVCVSYAGIGFVDETSLRLLHFDGISWVDTTISLDTLNDVICGSVSSLSPFIVAAPSLVSVITASVDVQPKTLNKNAKGTYITVYIEFSGDTASPTDIDVSSVTLSSAAGTATVPPESPTAVGDENGNGIIDRMVKFDRATVESWFSATGEQTVRVEGRLVDGQQFTGDDIIVVIAR
jgi:hypothetical protein